MKLIHFHAIHAIPFVLISAKTVSAQCDAGFYSDGENCIACQYNASNVPSGFYLSSVCDGTTTSDVAAIAECTAVPNCAGEVVCTNANDSQCLSCDSGFYLWSAEQLHIGLNYSILQY